MTEYVSAFDHWVRTRFRDMNTELEQIYFATDDRSAVCQAGADIRQGLLDEGHEHVVRLLAEGNTDEGFESAYDLLGNVGTYMAACRRHEMTEPSRETRSPLAEASALALQLGASLGVTPRFATSHLTTHNYAIDGRYKTFTSLQAEKVFLDYNTLGIFAYRKAADSLARILMIGISHPATYELLVSAETALREVARWNDRLFRELDVDRFFYCVRPYYKPYRVGPHVYRGANAGDFAGINEVDMLLGLCNANNSSYAQILVDKFLYMTLEDQARLRDCMRREDLLRSFLDAIPAHHTSTWFQSHARKFLDVCEAHGETAIQHHEQLVRRFIQQPAEKLPPERLKFLTASGPPLPVLLKSLKDLKDLRVAAERDDIPSRYREFRTLAQAVAQQKESL